MQERIYTAKEVANILDVSYVTLCIWRKLSKIDDIRYIPCTYIGNRVYYKHSDLLEFIEKNHGQNRVKKGHNRIKMP